MTLPRDLVRTGHYIGGTWLESGDTYQVCNPADGELLARIARGAAEQAEAAIAAAANALPGWRERLAEQRGDVLRRWGDLLLEHEDDLATVLTAEQGKPLSQARSEIRYAAGFFHWFAEEARRIYGRLVPPHRAGARILVTREPVGVVAAITPWNFPIAMITRKAGAALAAGCTMVVKPSEETPLTAHALAVLGERAGVPAGVFNVLSGDAEAIGETLMASPMVRKLSFTGSVGVGKLLMRQAADTLKKVSLELGGNAPFIVFDDADLDAAVDGLMTAKFRNTGQTCVCAQRIFVQAGVHDAFVDKLTEAMQQLVVAPGDDPDADLGPLINSAAVDKVRRHVRDAVSQGARVQLGGEPHPRGGTFWSPTLLTGVTPEMLVSRDETFGPVAAVRAFHTEEEVLELANDTRAGLASYFYTRDLGRAWRVAEGLEAGMVGVNTGLVSTPVAPFGGIKESGLGREGSFLGVEDYLEPKYILMDGLG